MKKDILSFEFQVKDEKIIYNFPDAEIHPDLLQDEAIIKGIKHSDQKYLRNLNESIL